MKRLTVLMVLVASICFAQTKVDWRQIKNTPTTVEGYGITDVAGAEELERLKNELERIEGEIPDNASFTYEALTHTDGEILENYLATDSVTTEKILDDAVTTEKILDGAVTDAKIDSLSSRKLTGDITTDDVSIAIHADVEGDYPPTIHRADTVTKTRGLYLSGGDKPVSEGMEGFNLFLGSATDPYMRAFAGTILMMQMFPPSMGLDHPISFKEPVIIEGDLQISNKLGIFNFDADDSEAYDMSLTNDKGEAILDMNGYKLKLGLDAHSVTAKLDNSDNKVIFREATPGHIELVTPNNAILTLKGGEVVADPLKAGKLDLYRGQAALSVEDTSTSGYSNVLLDVGNLTSQASNRLNLYAGDNTKLILKDGVASLTGQLNVSGDAKLKSNVYAEKDFNLGGDLLHGNTPVNQYTPNLRISGGPTRSAGSFIDLATPYRNTIDLQTTNEDTKLHMEDGVVSLTGKLNVSGDTVINGKLTVDGVNGLRVTGGAGAYIDSVLAVGGNISHGSTTGSTPNLIISGGSSAGDGSTLELSTGFKNKIELKTADGDTKITMEDGSVTVTDRLEVTGDLDVKGRLRAYPSELENQYRFTMAMSWVRGDYESVGEETFTAGPAVSGSNKFYGGVLLPDGRVCFVPYSYANIGIYDPVANTFTAGPAVSGSYKFYGGVLLPDGRVCLVPGSYANIGIYDPVANTFTDGPAVSGSDKFRGGVLLPDGRVCLAPFSYANIGIYDPVANTFTDGPAVSGSGKFLGGVLLPDGRVCLVPLGYGNIGIYDPVANTFTDGPAVSGGYKFYGGVLLPDGRVCLVPFSYANIGIYDPVANTFTDGPAVSGDSKFVGAVLLPDGRVCLVPSIYANIGIYDPVANTFTAGPAVGGSYRFYGGVLLPDGRVCLAPLGYGNIGIYDPKLDVSAVKGLASYLRLPFFNKF